MWNLQHMFCTSYRSSCAAYLQLSVYVSHLLHKTCSAGCVQLTALTQHLMQAYKCSLSATFSICIAPDAKDLQCCVAQLAAFTQHLMHLKLWCSLSAVCSICIAMHVKDLQCSKCMCATCSRALHYWLRELPA